MKKIKTNNIEIKYKKVFFNFEILETLIAGIQLLGTEIKSIRERKVSFNDAYCILRNGELFIKGLHIAEYTYGNIFNHDPDRPKKLLLSKRELITLRKKIDEKGLTIVPIKIFINEKGLAKLEIAIAKGKKKHDKREAIKEKEFKRNINRHPL